MMRHLIMVLLMAISILGCDGGSNTPANVLKPDKMQAVMWDVIQADVFTSEYIKVDTTKNLQKENLQLQKKIFALHHTNREQYYTSYEYYKSKPDLMQALLDTMAARVNRNRNKTMTPIPSSEAIK